ncbi:MAG: hypothetical protein WCA35_24660 [Kovacikia sp.]
MTRTIVNLLTSVIAREAEEVLSTYSNHPYQQAFSIPDIRQELIAYVLSRAPGSYAVLDENNQLQLEDFPALQPSFSDKQAIRAWIHQGIHQIFDRYSESITKHIPEADDPRLEPSHWFG